MLILFLILFNALLVAAETSLARIRRAQLQEMQEGGVSVINTAPVRFDGGVQIGNGVHRLVPYTTGGKTYLTLEN